MTLEEASKTIIEQGKQIAHLEEQNKTIFAKLTYFEAMLQTINIITTDNSTMLMQIQQMQEQLKKHATSIESLEKKPHKWLDIIVQSVMTALIAGFIIFLFPHLK